MVSATLRLFDVAAAARPLGGRARHQAGAVPRPRRRARARRRAGGPGRARPGAGVGRRPVQGHRAGRGDLRPVRPPGDRPAPPGAGTSAVLLASATSPGSQMRDPARRLRASRAGRWSRIAASLPGAGRRPRVRRVVRPAQPAGRDRQHAARLPAGAARSGRSSAWPTCARSRGSSPGRRPGSTCPAGTASAAGCGGIDEAAAWRPCAPPSGTGRCWPCCSTTPR